MKVCRFLWTGLMKAIKLAVLLKCILISLWFLLRRIVKNHGIMISIYINDEI